MTAPVNLKLVHYTLPRTRPHIRQLSSYTDSSSSVGLFFLFSGQSDAENNKETHCGEETPSNQEEIGDIQGKNLPEQY